MIQRIAAAGIVLALIAAAVRNMNWYRTKTAFIGLKRLATLSEEDKQASIDAYKFLQRMQDGEETETADETKATFFVPGWTADNYTDAIAQCAKRGHEVAHHGYHHVPPTSFANAEEEREELERGIEAIEKATGMRPVGYRSPAWELSPHTLGLLGGLEFSYSSNMMDADGPYEHKLDGNAGAAGLVELPVSWTLDDYPFFMARPERTAGEVEEIWRDEFDALREREDAAFVLTMHPQIIGRPGRLAMLDNLIAYIRHSGDAELLRCDELASQTRA